MQPGTLAIPLRRNAAAATRLELYDGADQPIDLTGCSLVLEVRMYPGAPGAPSLRVGTDTGTITFDDAEAGAVEINWPMIIGQIRALPSTAEAGDPSRARIDTFAYDLLLIGPDGVAQALVEGTIPVSYGVTNG